MPHYTLQPSGTWSCHLTLANLRSYDSTHFWPCTFQPLFYIQTSHPRTRQKTHPNTTHTDLPSPCVSNWQKEANGRSSATTFSRLNYSRRPQKNTKNPYGKLNAAEQPHALSRVGGPLPSVPLPLIPALPYMKTHSRKFPPNSTLTPSSTIPVLNSSSSVNAPPKSPPPNSPNALLPPKSTSASAHSKKQLTLAMLKVATHTSFPYSRHPMVQRQFGSGRRPGPLARSQMRQSKSGLEASSNHSARNRGRASGPLPCSKRSSKLPQDWHSTSLKHPSSMRLGHTNTAASFPLAQTKWSTTSDP